MARFIFAIILALLPCFSAAKDITVGTVTRAPFSMESNGTDTGFSIDLWRSIAERIDAEYEIKRFDSFQEMLKSVQRGDIDLAIANISITSEREEFMDFSQPIFSAGLQIMTPAQGRAGFDLWPIVFSKDLLFPVVIAFGLLMAAGMFMWIFERGRQPYFDQPAKEMAFPAFWWALNLVVNGGFEERVPRSSVGRVFGVILVISSLFVVSIFVARITSMMTVEAIHTSIGSVNDLYGRQVGTVEGSTAAGFMDRRDMQYRGYEDLKVLLDEFEDGELDAVVFDAPILAYYAMLRGSEHAQLTGPVFLRENYGIALPTNSPLEEKINKALLNVREDGTYSQIKRDWFGSLTD